MTRAAYRRRVEALARRHPDLFGATPLGISIAPGWLARRGARVGAVGFGVGSVIRDGAGTHVRLVEAGSFSRPGLADGAPLGDAETAGQEQALLAGSVGRLPVVDRWLPMPGCRPLEVSVLLPALASPVGGRRGDDPLTSPR